MMLVIVDCCSKQSQSKMSMSNCSECANPLWSLVFNDLVICRSMAWRCVVQQFCQKYRLFLVRMGFQWTLGTWVSLQTSWRSKVATDRAIEWASTPAHHHFWKWALKQPPHFWWMQLCKSRLTISSHHLHESWWGASLKWEQAHLTYYKTLIKW